MTKISNCLADYVSDGDLHTQLASVEYSTDLRRIVTVGYMLDHFEEEKEKAVSKETA